MAAARDISEVAEWAARQAFGPRARVVAATPLRPGGSPARLEVNHNGTQTKVVVKTGNAGSRAELATEAAALTLAETYGLRAPRLLALDLKGEEAGRPALVMTHVDASDRIPVAADTARLHALGAATAAFHQVRVAPTPELPVRHRHMPWIDLAAERRRGAAPTTELLDRADRTVSDVTPPEMQPVFVHGDLWAGNTLWRGGTYIATIDWEAAGAGSYGVDLGSLRLDAALLHGLGAADAVLAGWEAGSGERATMVAYWDLVAATNTRVDMTGFTPTMHQAGRTDLDGPQLTQRRDEFLAAALRRL